MADGATDALGPGLGPDGDGLSADVEAALLKFARVVGVVGHGGDVVFVVVVVDVGVVSARSSSTGESSSIIDGRWPVMNWDRYVTKATPAPSVGLDPSAPVPDDTWALGSGLPAGNPRMNGILPMVARQCSASCKRWLKSAVGPTPTSRMLA